jgi:hypothetical protein
MSTPVKHSITIIQGTTQHEPLVRQYVEYAVKSVGCGGGYVNACSGKVVPPGDFRDEDYTGCTALMQMREDIDSAAVLWEMSTDNGRIELDGNTLTLVFDAADSSSFAFDSAIGHVEVTRPNGDVERQYEIKFKVSKEGTR